MYKKYNYLCTIMYILNNASWPVKRLFHNLQNLVGDDDQSNNYKEYELFHKSPRYNNQDTNNNQLPNNQ